MPPASTPSKRILSSPATYSLVFAAKGFLQSEQRVYVDAGQAVVANTVDLSAGLGEIEGTVTGGSGALGGVSVTASANGNTFMSATPTVGGVGQFSLPRLPTPATYLLTFSKRGFASRSVAVDLTAGKKITGLGVSLIGGTGTVSGTVVGSGNLPLGGVTVTVGGTARPASRHQTWPSAPSGRIPFPACPPREIIRSPFLWRGTRARRSAWTYRQMVAPVVCSTPSSRHQWGESATVPSAIPPPGVRCPGVAVTITSGALEQQTITAASPARVTRLYYSFSGRHLHRRFFPRRVYSDQTALVVLQAGQSATEDVALVMALSSGTGAATPPRQETSPTSPTTSAAGTKASVRPSTASGVGRTGTAK